MITLVNSLLNFAVGMFKIPTEKLSSTPLIAALIFAITGLIGVVTNRLISIKEYNA